MAKVKFVRKPTDIELQEVAVTDGQFLVSAEGTSYVDYDEERVAIGGSADSEMSDTSINAIQNKVVKAYVDKFIQALGLSVDTYSTSTSYAVDDLVIYDNTIYSCNTATSGAWDSSKWDIVQNLDPSTMQINSKLTKNLVKQSELDELTTYSTEEKVVGTWIDGKPIYRKTFTGTKKEVNNAISDSNLDRDSFIRGFGWIYSVYENWWQIGSGTPATYQTSLAISTVGFELFTTSTAFNDNSQTILTLEYTKTTD